MENLVLSNREFEDLMKEVLPIVASIMQEEYEKAIVASGRVMTQELLNSFNRDLQKEISDFAGWVQASFKMYGRFLDMKYVEYKGFQQPKNKGKKYSDIDFTEGSMPDIVKGFLRFIKERKLINSAVVPGYNDGSKRMPSTGRAEMRLAWAMVAGRMRKGKLRVRKGQDWYNVATTKIRKAVGPIAAEKTAAILARNVAGAIGD
jgi:hypothetical protein